MSKNIRLTYPFCLIDSNAYPTAGSIKGIGRYIATGYGSHRALVMSQKKFGNPHPPNNLPKK